jgi:hypothetical protein
MSSVFFLLVFVGSIINLKANSKSRHGVLNYFFLHLKQTYINAAKYNFFDKMSKSHLLSLFIVYPDTNARNLDDGTREGASLY